VIGAERKAREEAEQKAREEAGRKEHEADKTWRSDIDTNRALLIKAGITLSEAYQMTGHRSADRGRTLSVHQEIKGGQSADEIHANLADRDSRYKLQRNRPGHNPGGSRAPNPCKYTL